jgi:hypothetical protein
VTKAYLSREPTHLARRARSATAKAAMSPVRPRDSGRDRALEALEVLRLAAVATVQCRGMVWPPDRRHPGAGRPRKVAANRGRRGGRIAP